MKLLLFVLSILTTMAIKAQEQATLYYIGDPMCSWCYGFSPEFTEAIANVEDDVKLEMVMGGLRPFNQEKMTDLKSFLTEHWEEVHERSQQPFNYDILNSTDIPYDTEPSCRAVALMVDMAPHHAWSYFQEVQKAFYYGNKNPINPQTFSEIARQYQDIDHAEFERKFTSEQYRDRVKEHFQLARQMGVNSFPTVILQKGENYYLIARGYADAAYVTSQIEKALLK